MKKTSLFIGLVLIISMFVIVSGCGTLTKQPTTDSKNTAKLDKIENKIDVIQEKKLGIISELSYGISYSLAKSNYITADNLNDRILTISGIPDLSQIIEIKDIVDKNQLNRLNSRIISLQYDNNKLEDDKSALIKKLSNESNVLNEYKKWFGFGAIWLGLKQLFTSTMWFLIGGSAIFLVLRIFAASNPIAGAIFAIFNVIGGYFIKLLNYIIPKSIEFSGHIATSAYNESKLLLTKIIDNIQTIKVIEKQTGQPITLKELLVELDKSLDKSEKEIIKKIKSELGY